LNSFSEEESTQCILFTHSKSTSLNRHYTPKPLPKVTPLPASTLPLPRRNRRKLIRQPRVHILRHINQPIQRRRLIRRPTRLIEIQHPLIGRLTRKREEGLPGGKHEGRGVAGAGGCDDRDTGDDEGAPDFAERGEEGGAEVGARGAEVRDHVVAVAGGGDAVLVVVRAGAEAGVGCVEPVGGADEGCFGVDVLKMLVQGPRVSE
jgi:hypothetical protein